jgi:autotransporter-associated beta strand protein
LPSPPCKLFPPRPERCFVVNSATGTVGEYTTDGATINASLITGLTNPNDIAVSGTDLYIAGGNGTNGGYVDKFTTSGTPQNVPLISGLGSVQGIAVSGTDLYAVEATTPGNGIIGKFTTSGGTQNANFVTGLNNSPGYLTVSGGNLYLSNYGIGGAGTIGKYDAATGAVVPPSPLITGLSYARGVQVSGTNLFVLNYSPSGTAGYLGEYTTAGGTVNSSLITGLDGPAGLALFGGNLFYADHTGGKIGEYTTTGGTVNPALVTGLGLGQISGIAVVPEPGSLALAGVACGLLLIAGWRRWWPARRAFKLLCLFCLCGYACLAVASPVLATSGTWSLAATTGAWPTTSNWVAGNVPGATTGTTNGNTATFNSASTTTVIIVDPNRNLSNITFDLAAVAYAIGPTFDPTSGKPDPLILTSGGTIQIASTFTGTNTTETISVPLRLQGNCTFADNVSGATNDLLLFNAANAFDNISMTMPNAGIYGGLASGTQTLTVSGSGNTRIDAIIGDGGLGGTIALTKSGTGTATLTAANTFSGGVAINGGSLVLGSSAAMPMNAAVSMSGGISTTLVLNGNSVTLSALTGNGAVLNGGATNATLTVANAGNGTLSNSLQDGTGGGSLALVKDGAGQFTLGGNDTFTGGVTIKAGTLAMGNDGALNSASPNSVFFGPGSTGTLDLNGHAITVSGLSTADNLSPVVVTNSAASTATLTVNLAGAATVNTFAGSFQGSGSNTLRLTKSGTGTLILAGTAANVADGLVSVNDGTLQLSKPAGTQAVSASLNVGDGVGAANSAQVISLMSNQFPSGGANVALQSDGLLSVGANVSDTIKSLTMTGGTVTGAAGSSVTISGNTTTNASPMTATISIPMMTVTSGGIQFTVASGPAANGIDLDVPAVLAGDSSQPITKAGQGTLRLSGNNTFLGRLHLANGNLLVGSPGALNASSPAYIAFDPGTAGILTLNGFSVAVSHIDTTSSNLGNPIIQNASSTAATLTIADGGTDNTYPGTIQDGPGGGSLAVTKTGSGTLRLTGTLTFTGPLTIADGTFVQTQDFSQDLYNQGTFIYNTGSGKFNGRLYDAGIITLNALSFKAGNGIENDGILTMSAGETITAAGQGLDNEGTLNFNGGNLFLSATNMNVNHGNINLTAAFNMDPGTTLTNYASLALSGASVGGLGTLVNTYGGTIVGTGAISTNFLNSGGLISVGGGTLNITHGFNNMGIVQLTALSSNLAGGAITNTNLIEGVGNVGNAIINNGTIQPRGGSLFVSGALSNPVGGLLTAGSGSQLFVTQGLPTNAGVINLTGGTFDNGGHPLTNASTGQISGWGIFRTGGAGLDNHGNITFSGGTTTVTGPVTNESDGKINIAYNPVVFSGQVTNTANGSFNLVGNPQVVFAGGSNGTPTPSAPAFVNSPGADFAVSGDGLLEVDGVPKLGNASAMSVGGSSTMRFKATGGHAAVGSGVTAAVGGSATLELAGTVASLASLTGVASVLNNSTSFAGLLVTGVNQFLGGIDGSGITQVLQGSLTVGHIIQDTLAIIGTPTVRAVVSIVDDVIGALGFADGAALDSALMPFGASNGLNGPIGALAAREASGVGDWALGSGADSFMGSPVDDPMLLGTATSATSLKGGAAVPEPTAMTIAGWGIAALLIAAIRRQMSRR